MSTLINHCRALRASPFKMEEASWRIQYYRHPSKLRKHEVEESHLEMDFKSRRDEFAYIRLPLCHHRRQRVLLQYKRETLNNEIKS